MEAKAEEKIEFYCGLFNRLYESVSKVNPEHAVEISLVISQEIAKDLRAEQIAKLKIKAESESVASEELATTKQREALHKFGVKQIPEDLSKEEASETLELLIGFSKNGDSESISRVVEELNRRWVKKENQQRNQ